MIKNRLITGHVTTGGRISTRSAFLTRWLNDERILLPILLALAAMTWIPRLQGPLDLRWDGGVYYILGTSLAEGKGYRLLNEPGEIHAVQYPPLLPLIIAGYQFVLNSSDPTIVGKWLRLSAILLFLSYIYAVFKFFRHYLGLPYAFLASILCLFSLHVYFLSDLCFPEILFSFTTILFFLCSVKQKSRRYEVGAYLFAVASYALRTIGISVLIVWVLESAIKRQFKQAVLRLALAIIPVMGWQFYIASIEKSYEYDHPAYSYQRAPYLFYNVTYSRNIALEDPFAPEQGKANLLQRAISNFAMLPTKLGQSIATPYYTNWVWKALHPLERIKIISNLIPWLNLAMAYLFTMAVFAGLVLQVFQRKFLIPLYAVANLGAICLTPFLGQYPRYIMPVTPFLILGLALFFLLLKTAAVLKLSPKWHSLSNAIVLAPFFMILLFEIATFIHVHRHEYKPVEYIDINNRLIKQRVAYRVDEFKNLNKCIDYLKQHALPNEVIASGSPQWVYLRMGMKAVMPPFEINTNKAQLELDGVPVAYLVVGTDVIDSDRYTLPVVNKFTDKWKKVFVVLGTDWMVFQRITR